MPSFGYKNPAFEDSDEDLKTELYDQLKSRYFSEDLSEDARNKFAADARRKQHTVGGTIGDFLTTLGSGLQGRDSSAVAIQLAQNKANRAEQEISDFDRRKSNLGQDLGMVAKLGDFERKKMLEGREDSAYELAQETLAEEKDPNSEKSRQLGQYLSKYLTGFDPSGLSYERMKSILPLVESQFESKSKENLERIKADAAIKAAREKAALTTGPMVGAKKADEQFGKIFAQTAASGGFSQEESMIEASKEVIKKLRQPKTQASGKFIGNLPKAVRDTFNEEGAQLEDQARNVVLPMVKKLFPGATSNWESETALSLVWNPRVDEIPNAERMESWVKKAEKELKNRKSAFDYYSKNGTIHGYTGPLPDETGFSVQGDESNKIDEFKKTNTGPIQMKFPDGSIYPVSPDEMKEARLRGGKPI